MTRRDREVIGEIEFGNFFVKLGFHRLNRSGSGLRLGLYDISEVGEFGSCSVVAAKARQRSRRESIL